MRELRTSSSAKQDPNGSTRPTRRTRATYRLRGIHESFDCASLENALCTYFGVEKDGLTIHSLAFDAPYSHSSRRKVATITSQTISEILREGNRWQAKILPPQGGPEELCNVYFDTTFEGFTPLTAAEQEDDTHIDCILIHGWAGHSIGSFSSPDGDWFWPRDSLCHEIPKLRVWLYGYSSDLRNSGSITDVYEYADTFRRALTDARKSSDPRVASRPLIYIVHSLGGWILQDAIVRMTASNHPDDKTNLSMTKAVLLFGVPSLGMENQQLLGLLQEDDLPAMYTASLLDERYGFRLRMCQADDFYSACFKSDAIIYAFYETEETPTVCRDEVTQRWIRNGPPALLVSKISATYGPFETRNKIAWKSEHNSMLKLRRGDIQYEILLNRLHEIVQQIESSQAGQAKLSPALTIQPKSPSNKYHTPFSIRGLPVTKKFIDRPAEMQPLQEILLPKSDRRKTFVLRGLGGIGKTQLAIEFIRRYHSKFSAVFWLDGNSEDSLKRTLARYAGKIASDQMSDTSKTFVRSGEGDVDTVVQEVLEWLAVADNNAWLLVFDNVDQENEYDIEQYLPDADHGSILITTRLAQMEQLGDSQEVRKVNSDTALAILKSWYKRSYDESDMEQLLEQLDGLPLAIAQAGAYLQESGINIKAYLRVYKDMQKDIEMMHDSSVYLRDYPNGSVWTTWNISYASILAQNEHVARLLILWSFLDRSDLWYGIFEKVIAVTSAAGAFSQWLGGIANQESSFFKAMHLLRRYSLIESPVDTDGYSTDGYSMHTVVHQWAYSYQGLKHQRDLGMLALITVGFAIPMSTEREYVSLQRRLLPHAQTCTARILSLQIDFSNHFTDWDDQQKDILIAVCSFAMLYADQGRLEEAENMYMRALQGCEEALGAKHVLTLSTVTNLGSLYNDQNKLRKAEDMYVRAFRGYGEAFGVKHKWTINAINNLGCIYADQDRLEEAEKMLLQAMQGKEEVLGVKHVSTLDTLNNIGLLCAKQGKLDEAGKIYMRALQGYEEVVGAKHTLTLQTVNNLGLLYRNQGKFEESEKMLLRALQGKEEALGAKHRSTVDTIYNLGLLYQDQGKYNEAEKNYMQALQGYEEALGVGCIPALNIMRNLGDLYYETRPNESRAMYAKALSGYTIARGAAFSTCIYLKRRIDILDILQQ